MNKRQTRNPERDVMAAALLQAVEDARSPARTPRDQMNRRSARRWLESDESGERSFRWFCDLLDLDPAAVREAVFGDQRRAAAEVR